MPTEPALDLAVLDVVMLDCDGVMFDSHESNIAFYDEILRRLDRPPLDASGRDLAHRLSTPQVLAHFFPDDPATRDRGIQLAREMDYAPFLDLLHPMEQLFETLDWLRTRYRTAMVTNRGTTIPALVERFGLADHFDQIVGLADVTHPKPAPDMLQLCLSRFDCPPARAVYVGDSPGDRAAARAADTPFIGVGDAVPAFHSINHLRDLPGELTA